MMLGWREVRENFYKRERELTVSVHISGIFRRMWKWMEELKRATLWHAMNYNNIVNTDKGGG